MLSWLISGDYPSGTGTLVFWAIQTVAIASILLWFYNYIRHKQSLWRQNGIPGPEPFFLLGNDVTYALRPMPDVTMERYRRYGKLCGGYQFLTPVLEVYDADIAKQILIKDFHCFFNRQPVPTYHEMINQNMFFSRDQEWKRLRTIGTPSFASGKLRKLAPLMNDCIEKLFRYLDGAIDRQKKMATVAIKEVVAGFTLDVIAWTSFSTDTNANGTENRQQHPFIINGFDFFRINAFHGLALALFPGFVLRLIGVKSSFRPCAIDYFANLSREIIRQRKQSQSTGTKPQDLLQMLLDAEADETVIEHGNLDRLTAHENEEEQEPNQGLEQPKSATAITKKMTETEVIANSILFLIAGFETTASIISHCLFQLAWHPEIQERLHLQLVTALTDIPIDSPKYFDTVNGNFPYLEAVIKETFRTFPPVTILDRSVSVDDYRLNGVPLPRGTWIRIGVHVIHHMEKYYENPNEFWPDRWLSPNREHLNPYAYLPFGLGPRNCIAMRFAYQEIRLALARILIRYRFEVAADTPRKLDMAPRSSVLLTSPFNLNISLR